MADGKEEDEHPDLFLISQETIQNALREIERSLTRSRKTRIKLLFRLHQYFENISGLLRDNDYLAPRLLDVFEDIQDLIVAVTNLSVTLSNPPTQICEVYDTLYDMGAFLETIIIAMFDGCQKADVNFGEAMKDFVKSLIKVSCDNPDTWLYSVLISPIVSHIMNAFARSDLEDFRTAWCYEISDLMFQVARCVFDCGDFYCQHYLVTLFSCWAKWTAPGRALPVINSVFSCVDSNARKELLRTSENPVEGVRAFMNALNLSSRGPNSIIPIPCMYLFVCNKEIHPPEHQVQTTDFWVDFSIVSGRLHAFYSIPGAAALVSLSIRRDQIHSVCLNWVINDGRSQASNSQEDSDTQSTFMKDEKVLFFHIVLSVDFEAVTSDIESMIGKHYRSIYLVFRDGDLVEKVMQDMGYNIHECGTNNCERPRALRRLLTTEHKLSYTESWCPESQVFGLDKSLTNTSVSALSTPKSICNTMDETRLTTYDDENEDLEEAEFKDDLRNDISNQSIMSNISKRSSKQGGYHLKSQEGNMNQSCSFLGDDGNEMENDSYEEDLLNNITNLSIISTESRKNSVAEKSLNATGSSIASRASRSKGKSNSKSNSLNSSMKENQKPRLVIPLRNRSILSRGSDTSKSHLSITVSSETTSNESLDGEVRMVSVNQSDVHNVSVLTEYEDPLPPSARAKYGHLAHHTPFYEPNEIERIKPKRFKFVRSSSPKATAPLPEPITPPISEIGSPLTSIWNLTLQTEKLPPETGTVSDPVVENPPKVPTPYVAVVADESMSSDEESFKSVGSENGTFSQLSPVYGFSRTLEAGNTSAKSPAATKVASKNQMLTKSPTTPNTPKQLKRTRSDSENIEEQLSATSPSPITENQISRNAPSPQTNKHVSKRAPLYPVANEQSPSNTPSPLRNEQIIRSTPSPVANEQASPITPSPLANEQISKSSPSPVSEKQKSGNLSVPVTDKQEPVRYTPSRASKDLFSSDSLSPIIASSRHTLVNSSKKPTMLDDSKSRKGQACSSLFMPNVEKLPPVNKSISRIPESPDIEDDDTLTPPIPLKSSSSKKPTVGRTHQRSTQKSVNGKAPCYANSFVEWMNKIKEQERLEDFDPYDLWASSEMDEYRNHLFPKTKTYSKGNKRKRLDGSLGRQLKIVKVGKYKKPQNRTNKGDDEVNTEEFAFKATVPKDKRSSIFKKRG